MNEQDLYLMNYAQNDDSYNVCYESRVNFVYNVYYTFMVIG